MCKKSLLFVLLMALFAPWAAQAQTTVTIGEGTSASYYAPIGTLYNYSITEQLYTADEIGMPGTIQSISFNYALSEAKDFPIEVYMKAVDAADLSTGISLADADLVFDGTVSVSEPGWVTITLDSPFVYDGTSNLLIGVNKDYVQWFSGSSWYYTSVANMTRYSQNDNNPYDASTTTPGVATSYRPNIQMEIVESSGPYCAKPTGVAVNYTGGTTAEVSWNSDAASFNIDVNGIVTYDVTNHYPLTSLDLATTYTVKVQAVCGGENGSSDWTAGTSFTTDMCMPEDQCELTFVVTDSYGDGWNGNAIVLTDVQTGAVLATIANQNLDGTNGEETQTVTFAVCDGRPIEFSWTLGSYVGEVSYTVTDINNEVVVEGSGASFETFSFTPNCTPVTCERPLDLAVTYNGGTTALVTWQAHAESYNIDLNGTVIDSITETEYELTGLDLATVYTVMVQANCGEVDGLSNWTAPVSFMTDLCMPENMCAISFDLVDSYGDGWNGAAIQVYDYDTITDELTLLTEATIESGNTASYELNVCDGRYLVFFWSSGNYDSECSYAVYDNLGDPIFSGSGAMDDYELFWMNCNSTCRMPRNFAASEIAGRSVMLSWTELGEATSWTLAYMAETDTVVSYIEDITTNPYLFEGLTPETKYYAMISPNCEDQYKWSDVISWTTDAACPKPQITVVPTPNSAEVSWTGSADEYEFEWAEIPASESKDALWLQYDDDTYVGGIGNSSANTWTWGVMYPASMLEGNGLLSKVSIYETADYNTEDITINIYSGGDDAPGELVYTETVTPEAADAFHEITLSEVVTVDPTQNLWITLTEYGTYVMSYCQVGDNANNDWVYSGSAWAHIGDLAASLAGDTWMIRAYVEPSFDPNELDWQRVPGATSPEILSPLNPETQYIVRIKALCGGEDGESEWATVTFWTPSLCTVPFDLANEVAATSADLSWTGYQESYNVRYRVPAHYDEITFEENFDEGMDQWTTIDADEDGYTWVLGSECGGIYLVEGASLAGSGHNQSADFVTSGSYSNVEGVGALTPDNYLVSPQLTLGGVLEFWACAQDGSYAAEHFGVAVSTSGNTDAANFTTIAEWTMTNSGTGAKAQGTWGKFTVDLSAYTGQGYVAIRHFNCTDMFMFNIDDIAYGTVIPTSEWITVTTTEPTVTLTGLTPETDYEWQVQGVNCAEGTNTEWSEIATFTTPELTTITQTVALTTDMNWFSTYLDITLDDLKAALVAAVPAGSTITIKNATQNTQYTRGRWVGNLDWDVAMMYKISVPTACEITLEGMPLDPTEHPITIAGGGDPTWIGFPFSQSMSVTNAFAGFAVNGDIIKSSTGNSQYTRGRWVGSVTELQPGEGYLYISADNAADRVLVFPAPSKAKNTMNPMTVVDPNSLKRVQNETVDLQLQQVTRKSAKDILSDLKKPVKNFKINK